MLRESWDVRLKVLDQHLSYLSSILCLECSKYFRNVLKFSTIGEKRKPYMSKAEQSYGVDLMPLQTLWRWGAGCCLTNTSTEILASKISGGVFKGCGHSLYRDMGGGSPPVHSSQNPQPLKSKWFNGQNWLLSKTFIKRRVHALCKALI